MPRRQQERMEVEVPVPAKTPEGRQEQLISAAVDLAEKRILNETASAQEVIHFLRLASQRNRLEEEKIRNENLLLETKVRELESRKSTQELYENALNAMRGYAGLDPIEMESDEDEELY